MLLPRVIFRDNLWLIRACVSVGLARNSEAFVSGLLTQPAASFVIHLVKAGCHINAVWLFVNSYFQIPLSTFRSAELSD